MNPETPTKPLPALRLATLYLVATPIGNMEDMSARAKRTLMECDAIAAEDTRRAGLLLQRLGFRKPLVSYHRFNEARRSREILDRLSRGERVALISDAGTPAISDPGHRVVHAAVREGYRVESVPGPCALIAALTSSGLPTDEFHFVGFLPQRRGQRRSEWERVRNLPGTLALYESPYRMDRLLEELVEFLPNRQVVVARELTKRYEEIQRGTANELKEKLSGRSWKGEVTVLIGPEQGDTPAGLALESPPRSDSTAQDGELSSVPPDVCQLALIQMRVDPGDPDANLARAATRIREARDTGAHIVLLPEVLDCGWTHPCAREAAGTIPGGDAVETLRAAAIDTGLYVCAGISEREGDRVFNAAVLIRPDGEILLHHRKIHEIPFARSLYEAGDRLAVAETPWGRVGLMICADALVPGLSVTRALAAMGAKVILSPCAWAVPPNFDPGKTPYGGLWTEHYGPVAKESGLWIAGCSNVGPVIAGEWEGWRCIGQSLVMAPDGEPVHWGGHGVGAEELTVVTLRTRTLASSGTGGVPTEDSN